MRVVLSLLLVCAAAVYLARFIMRGMEQLETGSPEPGWFALSGALLLSLAGHIFNSWLWWYSLQRMNVGAGFAEAYRSWAVSRLARYIPGKVFAYAVRVGLHSRQHRGASVGVAAVEAATALASLGIVSVVGAIFYWQRLEWVPPEGTTGLAVLLLVMGVVALILLRPFFGRLLARLFPEARWPDLSTWLRLTGSQILLLLSHAAAFFLVLADLTGLSWFWYPYVVAAYYIAALAGQLAVLVPAGLGVREASLLALLAPVAGQDISLFYAAVLIRLVLILSELLNAGISLALFRMARTTHPG